jgi:hypothetical protein
MDTLRTHFKKYRFNKQKIQELLAYLSNSAIRYIEITDFFQIQGKKFWKLLYLIKYVQLMNFVYLKILHNLLKYSQKMNTEKGLIARVVYFAILSIMGS